LSPCFLFFVGNNFAHWILNQLACKLGLREVFETASMRVVSNECV
jgi:hypothetical protein